MSKLYSFVNKVVLSTLIHAFLLFYLVECEPYNGGGSLGTAQIGIHVGGSIDQKCPRVCTCSDRTVDCSHRGLTQVPKKIPLDTERL